MTHEAIHIPTPLDPVPATGAVSVRKWLSCLVVVRRWCARYRQREQLGELDDRLLDDIGVKRGDAERERRKPFWR